MKATRLNKIGAARQRGFTIVELLVTLVVLGVLAAGAYAIAKKQGISGDVHVENENLRVVAASIRAAYASAPGDYTGLDNDVVRGLSTTPDTMKGTGSNLKHKWSATGITVAAGTPTDTYTITYASVPQDACAALAQKSYTMGESLAVNTTAVTTPGGAITACNAASNSMVWTFK